MGDINIASGQEVYDKLSKGFKSLEFMRICKENEIYFINYFEVIIDADGTTYFANLSHDKKLESLAKRNYKVDFRRGPYKFRHQEILISQFKMISVHYDYIKAGPYLTKMQQRALKIYLKAGLISPNTIVDYCYDYQQYKIAESFTKDDSDICRIDSYNVFNDYKRKKDKLSIALNDRYYISGNKETIYKPITVYRMDDKISFKYTENMEAEVVSENDNYFTIDYYSEIEKLDKYEPCCDYSIKLESFVKAHVATVDYPKDKFYYKIG